jgi:exodeoxyribonuclease VII large subunit
VFTVSELTRDIKRTLNESFDDVWVKGEISGFKRHSPSGHLYFQLKDENAILACAMWKMNATSLRFAPADGMEVEARGSIDVYPRRGSYQLLVRELLPGGRGALLLALEELRKKLTAEGLFDPERKRPLPRFPRRIALITSPTGAALRDLLQVLGRRWPLAEVVLVGVPVQGEGAAPAMAAALRRVNEWGWPEVVILGRGGGSLEDLWAFNEEVLVRAVAGSAIPTVSAVGHEVDHTLCDDAADVRAPTPSAAAEMVTPDQVEVARRVRVLVERAAIATAARIDAKRSVLLRARRSYGFRRPQDLLRNWAQELDALSSRLVRSLATELVRRRRQLAAVTGAYGFRRSGALLERLAAAVSKARARLAALSPRAVLSRGYALVRLPDGRLVRSDREIAPGLLLSLEFAEGGASARVESVLPAENRRES